MWGLLFVVSLFFGPAGIAVCFFCWLGSDSSKETFDNAEAIVKNKKEKEAEEELIRKAKIKKINDDAYRSQGGWK